MAVRESGNKKLKILKKMQDTENFEFLERKVELANETLNAYYMLY